MQIEEMKVIALRTLIAVAIVALPAAYASAQCSPEMPPVITHHQAQIGGKLLKYTAEVGRIAIRDVETAEPHGYMFYTAYRVPASSGAPRPLTLIWNGGPGADSSQLHFSVAGPRIEQGSRLLDNPDTWLTASDLVFVDPIGTGFSRPAKAEYDDEFYSTAGDVASVTEFVRVWRLLHHAERAPLFLAGESWGAGRAAKVAYALEKRGISVHGMVLISGGWGLNKNYIAPPLRDAARVVDMASTALFYGKTAPDLGKDAASVRHAAELWVRQTYAPALAHLDTVTEPERSAIVSQLVRFTGLPKEEIDHGSLTITPRQFRTGLLKDQHQQLYIFDMRRTEPPENPAAPAVVAYLRHELGYNTALPYIGLEDITQGFAPAGVYPAPVNQRWNYATGKVTPEELKAALQEAAASGEGPPRIGPPLPATEEALALNPRMKVLVAGGMYDSFLPCAQGEAIEQHLPPNLRQSLTFKCYVGGHAMYLDPSTRREFSHDIEALIDSAK